MFTRTQVFCLPSTDTQLPTAAASSDLLSVHEQIIGLRSAATGFVGDTTSTSENGLNVSYESQWDSEADYESFYSTNSSLIEQWEAFSSQYCDSNDIGIDVTTSGQ
jgi:hypothetical protein